MPANDGDDASESMAVIIAERVAEIERVDPCDLEPPLVDVLDVDALDRLLASGAEKLMITVPYRGHHLAIYGDGRVSVEPEPVDHAEPAYGLSD